MSILVMAFILNCVRQNNLVSNTIYCLQKHQDNIISQESRMNTSSTDIEVQKSSPQGLDHNGGRNQIPARQPSWSAGDKRQLGLKYPVVIVIAIMLLALWVHLRVQLWIADRQIAMLSNYAPSCSICEPHNVGFSDLGVNLRLKGADLQKVRSRISKRGYLQGWQLRAFYNFTQLQKDMQKLLDNYQVQSPAINQNHWKSQNILAISQSQIQEKASSVGLTFDRKDMHEALALKIAQTFYPREQYSIGPARSQQMLIEFQYMSAARTYNPNNRIQQQLPICIFVEDDHSLAEQKIHLANSLQAINYTNFHVVYVDDYASGDRFSIDQYLRDKDMRIKQKITFVRNQGRVGTTGNMYFRIREFCAHEDIVFLINKGSIVLGRQALATLNSIYQNQEIGYAISGTLIRRGQYDLVASRLREQGEEVSLINRQYSKKYQVRSFRRKLLDFLTIESLVQFRYDQQHCTVTPELLQTDSNSFPVYAHFSRIPKVKAARIQSFLELTLRVQPFCDSHHRSYVQKKSVVYRPKLKLKDSQPQMSFVQNRHPQRYDWLQFMTAQEGLNKCLRTYRSKLQFNLKNPVVTLKDDPRVWRRKIYNSRAANSTPPLGRDTKFQLDLLKVLPAPNNEWPAFKLQYFSNHTDVRILTPKDYDTVVKSGFVDFQQLQMELQNSIPYEVLEFQHDATIDMTIPQLQFSVLKNWQQAQRWMGSTLPSLNGSTIDQDDTIYQLAIQMQINPNQPQIIQSEYHLLDHNFSISAQTVEKQLPMCIISAGYNMYTRANGTLFKKYFESFQSINYTNYHIVYIDDFSPDATAQLAYQYVKQSKMRYKNKIKIVHTLKNVGITGNIFFWTQKMCGPDDIVLLIDADDNILGRQSLKVFNHYYSDPNIWYLYTKFIMFSQKKGTWIKKGYTFGEGNVEIRRNNEWGALNTRSFRANLMRAVPIYQFMQYHYSRHNYIAWPTFQDLAADAVQVYAHYELAGNARIAYYQGFTYGYSGTSAQNKCYPALELYDLRKTMSRTRLAMLESLGAEKGKLMEDDPFPNFYYNQTVNVPALILERCFQK